jgi:hypothetical protein
MKFHAIISCCFCLVLLTGCASSTGPIDASNGLEILSTSIGTAPSDILYNAKCRWFTKYAGYLDYSGGIYQDPDPGIAPEGILVVTRTAVKMVAWSSNQSRYVYLFSVPFSEINRVETHNGGVTIGIYSVKALLLLQVDAFSRMKVGEHRKIKELIEANIRKA